jgi:hypothetical protein
MDCSWVHQEVVNSNPCNSIFLIPQNNKLAWVCIVHFIFLICWLVEEKAIERMHKKSEYSLVQKLNFKYFCSNIEKINILKCFIIPKMNQILYNMKGVLYFTPRSYLNLYLYHRDAWFNLFVFLAWCIFQIYFMI